MKVFLKLDKFGNGLEIDQARLGMCKQLGDMFTEEKFRYMCILSGCDYLPSIHGIGLSKACKLLKIANNPDIIKVIQGSYNIDLICVSPNFYRKWRTLFGWQRVIQMFLINVNLDSDYFREGTNFSHLYTESPLLLRGLFL